MHQTQLIKLLKSLSPDELKRLGKFVRSPYFNTNKKLIDLFEILKKYYPEFDSPKLEKQKIFKKLFREEAFRDDLMRKTVSRLKQMTEEFLINQNLRQNQFVSEFLLTEQYGKRNLYADFEKRIEKELLVSESGAVRNADFFLRRFLLRRMIQFHPKTHRYTNKTNHVREIDRDLNYFFVLSKLHFGAELVNRENILAEKNDILFMDEILEKINSFSAKRAPLIEIYRNAISLLFSGRNDILFSKTKEQYQSELTKMSYPDKSLILIILLNYTMAVYYDGDGSLLNKQWALYKLGLEKEILIRDGHITDLTYLNIITTGGILKKYNEVFEFQSNYSVFLDKESKEEVFEFGKALAAFHKKDYSNAEELLKTFQPQNPSILLRSRFLLIMTQFDFLRQNRNYFETFIYQLEAFERFLRRSPVLSDNMKTACQNFVRFTRKLTDYIESPNAIKLEKMKTQIPGTKELTAKHWLISKISELK